jgi:hypothetical protein
LTFPKGSSHCVLSAFSQRSKSFSVVLIFLHFKGLLNWYLQRIWFWMFKAHEVTKFGWLCVLTVFVWDCICVGLYSCFLKTAERSSFWNYLHINIVFAIPVTYVKLLNSIVLSILNLWPICQWCGMLISKSLKVEMEHVFQLSVCLYSHTLQFL